MTTATPTEREEGREAKRDNPAHRSPLFLLTRHGYFWTAALLIVAAAHGESVSGESEPPENRPQAGLVGKSTTGEGQKSTTSEANNRPPNHWGMPAKGLMVGGLMSSRELKGMLSKRGWFAWASGKRMSGLLLLMADALDRAKAGRFTVSKGRSRAFCSVLRKTDGDAGTPRDGLSVLVRLGVFVPDSIGRRYPYACASEFRIGEPYASRPLCQVPLKLTAAQAEKWEKRHERVRKAYEQKTPVIAAVRWSASRVTLPGEGAKAILRLRSSAPDSFAAAERCAKWLDERSERVAVDGMGTVHTPINGCPRIIRPFLLIDGEEVAEVDISGAHVALLPKIYEPSFLENLGIDYDWLDAEREKRSMIAVIESGDVYGGGTPEERKKRKKETLISLNMEAKVQMAMPASRLLFDGRPIASAVMRAIKRKSHRDLSPWLLRWTSDIVNASVLALYERGIPSIPITDCLLVRKRDEGIARDELASRIYESAGVRAMVGGNRYAAPCPT